LERGEEIGEDVAASFELGLFKYILPTLSFGMEWAVFLYFIPDSYEPSVAVFFVIIEHECFDERAILLGGGSWMTDAK
jgi:hypothetical protein